MDTFGNQLRTLRRRRGWSQLALALEADVSPRHLSFLETGRAGPSPAMVRQLSRALDLTPAEHNVLRLAAGFAPLAATRVPPEAALDDVVLVALDAHPFPAMVLNRHRDVVRSNPAADRLLEHLLPDGPPDAGLPLNLFRLLLHPAGLAPHIVDFDAYSAALVARLRHDAEAPGGDHLYPLLAEVSAWPGVGSADRVSAAPVLRLRGGGSFVTTLATVGVQDSELRVEALLPV